MTFLTTAQARYVTVVVCPPSAGVPAFPSGVWPFDPECAMIIQEDELPSSACVVTDTETTDMWPDDAGDHYYDIGACPIGSGPYTGSDGYDFWNAMDGESIAGTWRMWLGSMSDGSGTDLGDFSTWSLKICSDDITPP